MKEQSMVALFILETLFCDYIFEAEKNTVEKTKSKLFVIAG